MSKIQKDNENSPSGRISAIEQRAYIRIETVRGKKVPEIHAALKEACGRFTVNRSTVQRWHTKFREGRTSIEDDPRHQQSKMKEMMIFAYDKRGVIATDRVPKGTSVTGAYYKNFLQNVLRPKIRKLRPGMLQSGVLILHDNARPHISAPIIELLEKYDWEQLRHPVYSPDLSPPDFDLFPKLKEPLRGVRFPTLEELRREVTRQIRMLNKNGTLNGIQALPRRWQACIDKGGDYIEGL